MKTYEQNCQEQINLIATAGPAIAVALGDGWTFKHYADGDRLSEYFFNLTHTDGTKLSARKENNTSRFMFAGDYPGGRYYSQGDPRIGLDLNRSASAVAADIKRRLLPGVRKFTKERFIYEAKEEQKEQRYQSLAYELATATGATLHKTNQDKLAMDVGEYGTPNRMQIEITRYANGPGSFDTVMTIRDMTPDMAKLIGQMIAADHKQRSPSVV